LLPANTTTFSRLFLRGVEMTAGNAATATTWLWRLNGCRRRKFGYHL
jgi:hypothetical protein